MERLSTALTMRVKMKNDLKFGGKYESPNNTLAKRKDMIGGNCKMLKTKKKC